MGKVQVSQAHRHGANVLAKAAVAGSAVTGTTKILLSFGSANNGFQYTIALREAIMERKSWTDKSYVFVDAVSAKDHKLAVTKENRTLNPVWSSLYLAAIRQCKAMTFIVTKPWLESQWCQQELQWWKRNQERTPIIVLMFADAVSHPTSNAFKDLVSDSNDFISVAKTLTMDEIPGVGPEIEAFLGRMNNYLA